MRSGGSKAKGSSFERLICKELSLWLSEDKRQDLFWRSSMSGGRATVALQQGITLSSQAGDITAIHSSGQAFIEKFYVECKSYKTLNIPNLITGSGGNFIKFWTEADSEAKKYNKLAFFIAKQNNFPILLCMKKTSYNTFVAPKINYTDISSFGIRVCVFRDFIKKARMK